MADFDEQQIEQVRQIVREEQRPGTNWGRVLFWIAAILLALVVLNYVLSQTLVKG